MYYKTEELYYNNIWICNYDFIIPRVNVCYLNPPFYILLRNCKLQSIIANIIFMKKNKEIYSGYRLNDFQL